MKGYKFGLQKGEKGPLSTPNFLRNVPAWASVGFVLVFVGLFYYKGYLAFNKEVRSTNYISPQGYKVKNSQHEEVQKSKTKYSSNFFLLKYFFKRNHRHLGHPTEEKTNKVKHTADHYEFKNYSTEQGNKYMVAIHYDHNFNIANNITTLLNFNKRERNDFKSIRNTPGTKIGGFDPESYSGISKQKTSTKPSLYSSEISSSASFKEMNLKNTIPMAYLSKVDTASNVKKYVSTNRSYKQSNNLPHGLKFSLYSHKDSYNETSHLIPFNLKNDTLFKSQINMAYKNEKEGKAKYNLVLFLDPQISFIHGSSSKNKSVTSHMRPHYKNYFSQDVNIPTKLRTKRDTRKPVITRRHTKKKIKSRRHTQKVIANRRQNIKQEGRIQRNYHENGNGNHRENSNSMELINFSQVYSRKSNKQPLKNKLYHINRNILYKDNTKIIVPNKLKGTRSDRKYYSCGSYPGKTKNRGHYLEEIKEKKKNGLYIKWIGIGISEDNTKTHEIFGARNFSKGECEELVKDVVLRKSETPGESKELAEDVVLRDDDSPTESEELVEDVLLRDGDTSIEGVEPRGVVLGKSETPGGSKELGEDVVLRDGDTSTESEELGEDVVLKKAQTPGESEELGEDVVPRDSNTSTESEELGKDVVLRIVETPGEGEEPGEVVVPRDDETLSEGEEPGSVVPRDDETAGDDEEPVKGVVLREDETAGDDEEPVKGVVLREDETPAEGEEPGEDETPGEDAGLTTQPRDYNSNA